MIVNMLKRTVTGLILAGLMFLAIYLGSFDYGFFALDAILLIFITVASFEMFFAMKKKFNPFITPVIVTAAVIYPLQFFFGFGGLFAAVSIGFFATAICFVFSKIKREFTDLSATFFILIYPLAIGSLSYSLHKFYGVIPLLIAVWSPLISDLFAYFFGSIIGGPKSFPDISPKKTISGSIAGIIGGVAGALCIYAVFEYAQFPSNVIFTFTESLGSRGAAIGVYAALGFVCGILGEIGDLTASLIKRKLEIKDYSNLLGTHGGFMDRIDSILFGSMFILPVMLVFFA